MEKDHLARKLAVILHADVVGSTKLVQQNESIAHERIQGAFVRFSETIKLYNGIAHELRGDALVAEFERASDACAAALAFQVKNGKFNSSLEDDIQPQLRIGISLGEVVVADNTVTGAGVVLAQRLEQLAAPEGVVVQGTVSETVPTRLPFEFESLGEQTLKGFDQPTRAFAVHLRAGESVPNPIAIGALPVSRVVSVKSRTLQVSAALVALVAVGAALVWYSMPSPDVLELPSGPRVAVMPFTNLGDESGQNLSIGMTEDIITALRKFEFFVFPRQTTSQFQGASCQDVGDALDAEYILEGTVRRSEDRIRFTTQLLDPEDCAPLWSESYDRKLKAVDDIFSVQDDITSRVVATIGSFGAFLWSWKIERVIRDQRTGKLEVYFCSLLSHQWYVDFSEETHRQSTECYERAVELEPDYSGAHAGLGWSYLNAYKYDYGHGPPDGMERALTHLRKAIELNPRNQLAHHTLAMHRLFAQCDWDAFRVAAEDAISINPNDGVALADLGTYIWASGARERGLALVSKAITLTPRYPRWMTWVFFGDHFNKGEFREALAIMLKMDLPNNHLAQIELASTYGHLGEVKKARKTIDHVLTIYPQFAEDPRRPFTTRCYSEEEIELVMDGLRKADYEVPPPKS